MPFRTMYLDRIRSASPSLVLSKGDRTFRTCTSCKKKKPKKGSRNIRGILVCRECAERKLSFDKTNIKD